MAKTEYFNIKNFQLGGAYTRPEIASSAGVVPPQNSRDWQGYREYENCIVLFVTLIKSDFDPSQMYADYFDDEGQTFFWDSQNRNTLNTPYIKRIISGAEVILFARITNKLKGKTLPFIYAGSLSAEDWSGEKPVSVAFNLNDYLPDAPSQLKELYLWSPGRNRITRDIEDSPERKRRSAEKKKTSITDAGGQGRLNDTEKKRSIELRAMDVAKDYYESQGYVVTDTSANKPYDLLCEKGNVLKRVEVKGTTQAPDSVNLTFNEVMSARDKFAITDLFVVHHIHAELVKGDWIAKDGKPLIFDDWFPKDIDLKPLEYSYKLPIN